VNKDVYINGFVRLIPLYISLAVSFYGLFVCVLLFFFILCVRFYHTCHGNVWWLLTLEHLVWSNAVFLFVVVFIDTLCPKKVSPLTFDNNFVANVEWFSTFFHQLIRTNILYIYITKISTTPATCCFTHYLVNIENPKNVTNFDSILNKLLTCSWGHFEDFI